VIGQSGENSLYLSASFDDVAFIKKVLSSSTVAEIWNGGNSESGKIKTSTQFNSRL
jgi:hypothetical protein